MSLMDRSKRDFARTVLQSDTDVITYISMYVFQLRSEIFRPSRKKFSKKGLTRPVMVLLFKDGRIENARLLHQ